MSKLANFAFVSFLTALVIPSYLSARTTADVRTQAELLEHDVKKINISSTETDSVSQKNMSDLLANFYMDQYRQFHDPEAPYFMFMTKDASLAMGVGGKIMMHGWYDWDGSQSSYDFYPYNIVVPDDPAHSKSLGGSVYGTQIFFTVLGKSKKLDYLVYVAIKAAQSGIKLNKAYITLNDFTLGYASTTFSDGNAIVPTVDAQGPNGAVSKTHVLGRYIHKFPSGWSVGGGVEFPASKQSIVNGETEQCSDYIPDIVGLVQYSWGGSSHVRLSGLLRTMTYRNLLTARNNDVVGWGLQLSGNARVFNPLDVYFSGMIGHGTGSYVADLSDGNYDLTAVSGEPGKMVAPKMFAVTAGLKYDFTKSIFACVGFGEVRYLMKNPIELTEYKYGIYGNVNLFWRISSRFLTGIEYVVGKRMNFNGQHASANRLDALLSFSF